jgi:hypothetical protein
MASESPREAADLPVAQEWKGWAVMESTTAYRYDEARMVAGIEAYQREQQAEKRKVAETRKRVSEPDATQRAERLMAMAASAPTRGADLRCRHIAHPSLLREPVRHLEVLPWRARVCCRLVCARAGMSLEELTAKCNEQRVVKWRQMAMYLMVRVARLGCAETGRLLGGIHHTTVIYACNTCVERCGLDLAYAAIVGELEDVVRDVLRQSGVQV